MHPRLKRALVGLTATLLVVACREAGGPAPARQPFPNPMTQVSSYTVVAVEASGFQDPNVPENTLDNNLGTRWSSEGDGQWIRYDLGSANDIGAVDIAWYQQLEMQPPNTWESEFEIQVSSDATNWTWVFSGRSVAGDVQHQRVQFPTITGRYVRIIGHGQWNGATLSSWWNSITEVDIHPAADACTSSGPQPGPGALILMQEGFESSDWGEWREMQDNMMDITPTSRYSKTQIPVTCGAQSVQALYAAGKIYGSLTDWFPSQDEIFVKFDVMFQSGFQIPGGMHFFSLAGDNPQGSTSSFGKAGVKPDGSNYFYAGLDPDPQNGGLGPFQFYTYWYGMACPLPPQQCFGENFPQSSPTPLTGGVWYEIVFHVKLNTPGLADGSQTLWIDGVKKIEVRNMEWRLSPGLKLNRVRFDNWMDPNTPPSQAQHVWVDDLIVWRP